MVVDRRLLPGTSEDDAVKGLRRRIEAAGVPRPATTTSRCGSSARPASSKVSHAFVGQVRRAIESVTGVPAAGHRHELHDRRPLRPQPGRDPGRGVRPGRPRPGPCQRRIRVRSTAWSTPPPPTPSSTPPSAPTTDAAAPSRRSSRRPRSPDIVRPRDGPSRSGRSVPGCFEQEEGPLHTYRRRVRLEPLADGRVRVVARRSSSPSPCRTSPGCSHCPLRWSLRAVGPDWTVRRGGRLPQRMTRRAALVLATLAALAVVVGYLGSLLGLTMTYAAKQFGVGKTGQGVAFGVVRINVLLALGLLCWPTGGAGAGSSWLTALAAAVLTASGALAPSLAWLTASQVASRQPGRRLARPDRRDGRRGDAGRAAGRGPSGCSAWPPGSAPAWPPWPSRWPAWLPADGGGSTSGPFWRSPWPRRPLAVFRKAAASRRPGQGLVRPPMARGAGAGWC